MKEADVYGVLQRIFRELFEDNSIILKPETSAGDVPGWDSVKMIEIILAVQQHFSIKIRTRETDRLKSVGDFVQLIISKSNS